MTDLSAKLGALDTQSATRHTELLAALGTLGDKLDAITTALGGAPPTATATLADVITAITGTNAILSDVHLDTISMDQKLLRLRDAINPIGESLPVEANSSIPWLLFRIMDAINPTWPRPTSVPAQPALSLLLALSQVQLPNLASIVTTENALSTVLGSPTDDTQSILRWLVDIAACACAEDANGFPSPNTTPTGCNDPYVSTGMAVAPWSVIPGIASLMFARFDTALPSGLSYGTVFGVTADHSELYNADWAGWRVYVASDRSQFSYTPTSFERLATNRWLAFPSGPGNYCFSVDAIGGLTVTLCPPELTTEECLPMSTIFIADEGCYFGQWPDSWPYHNGYGTGHWLHAELSGCKIWTDDPTGFHVLYSPNADLSGYVSVLIPGAGFENGLVLPSGTKGISLNSSSAFGGDSSNFGFWICPPPGGTLPPAALVE